GGGTPPEPGRAVPADRAAPPPAGKPRRPRRTRARAAGRRPAASLRGGVDAAPLPAALPANEAVAEAPRPGEGNAEEWLGAVPSSLAPGATGPPAVQRIRLRYRKVGPARFIGTRALGTTFLR